MKTAISRRLPPVAVEYAKRGTRVIKQFASAHQARRFYAAKLAAGAAPKVVKAETL